MNTKPNVKLKFEEIDKSWVKSMTPLMCPSCNNSFGLKNSFLEKVEDINFRFTCPYCSKTYGVKKV